MPCASLAKLRFGMQFLEAPLPRGAASMGKVCPCELAASRFRFPNRFPARNDHPGIRMDRAAIGSSRPLRRGGNDLWQLGATSEEAAHLGDGCWKIRDALPNSTSQSPKGSCGQTPSGIGNRAFSSATWDIFRRPARKSGEQFGNWLNGKNLRRIGIARRTPLVPNPGADCRRVKSTLANEFGVQAGRS